MKYSTARQRRYVHAELRRQLGFKRLPNGYGRYADSLLEFYLQGALSQTVTYFMFHARSLL
jgi:hypothetical protein